MKKKFLCFTFLLLILMKLPVLAAEYYIEPLDGSAVVTVETLNVRSGPSQNFSRIGALENGETATVKGFVEPDWYVIDYEGEEGYISSQYVSFTTADEMAAEIRAARGTSPLLVGALVLVILLMLVLIGRTIYSFLSSRKDEAEEDAIPLSPHDDTNMHLGEISYDTFRLDIDPALFETTTLIPQPESIYDELPSADKDTSGTPAVESPQNTAAPVSEGTTDIQSLDSKLEAASAQIASLQKEVEQLKKQNTENTEI